MPGGSKLYGDFDKLIIGSEIGPIGSQNDLISPTEQIVLFIAMALHNTVLHNTVLQIILYFKYCVLQIILHNTVLQTV